MTEPLVHSSVKSVAEPPAPPAEPAVARFPTVYEQAPRPSPRRGGPFAILIGFTVTAIAVLLFIHFRAEAHPSAISTNETATVLSKNFVSVLRLAGSTEALRSRPILAPELEGAQLNSMVVTTLAPAGTRVHKGDLLVEFDRQAQIKDALDKKAAYEDLVDQLVEKRATEEAARAKDEDDLHEAQDALTKAQLEMGKNEILSRIDVEKNQEALAETQQTLTQLQHTFDLKREAAAADLKTLQIQCDRARATMLYAQSNADKMSILSPMDGIIVLNNVWLNGRIGQVQEGDEVRPGVPFMKVVDPSTMEVRIEVNQQDLLNLHLGQPAQIRLDAYPGMSFPGTLQELDPLGHPSDQSNTIRTFTAIFSIQGSNPRLMPDLSASVDLQLASVKNALVVPAESVEHAADGDYVWLKSGNAFEQRTVKIGPSNGLDTVIESGLKLNDVVRRTPETEKNAA